MSSELLNTIREAEAALRQGNATQARLHLTRARSMAGRASQATSDLQGDVERYRLLMSRTLQVTLASSLEMVAESILDSMLTIVQARRGFVGLIDGSDWRFLVARNIDRADIDSPAAQVSTGIIAQVIDSGEPVITHDAADELSHRASVHQLQLRSVVCLPLTDRGRLLGFVYLDDPQTRGLFDEAALVSVQSWLPIVAGCVARAEESSGGLPGVVTRSARMRSELAELARIARFDAPILLTGETGTGKSLLARQIHAASPRARKPFVHVNCGAIPQALIEGELFGHLKGAFTGATADKAGKFEAAAGGTLFLDELDSLPPSCQVKLLVVLQERAITRLGANTPTPTDVRVIAAMGTDPFDAIDAGLLREDLYYRLAVFVASLPPLRERMEDIPLLASHFLQQTRERYSLPPIRLTDAALEALLTHDWPGNVRELANTLDRAALLAREGAIEMVDFRGRRRSAGSEPAPASLIARIERTAGHFVEALQEHPELRCLESADAFRSAMLLEVIRQQGSKDTGFAWLGLESLVKNRNHHRAFKREVARLLQLSEALGEPLSADLAALSGSA